MFRPERMSSISIICLRRDVDFALESLDRFGNFHIDETEKPTASKDYDELIQRTAESHAKVDGMIRQLKTEKSGALDIFREAKPAITEISSESWMSLAKTVIEETSRLKTEMDKLSTSLKRLEEKISMLQRIRDMLSTLESIGADLEAFRNMRFIYVAVASVPRKNLPELDVALAPLPVMFHHSLLVRGVEFVFLAMPAKHKDEVEKILKMHHAEVFKVPEGMPQSLSHAQEDVERQLRENLQEERTTVALIDEFGAQNKNKLLSLIETAQNILALLQAKRKFLQTERLVTIKGYAPQRQMRKLKEILNAELEGNVLVLENIVAAAEDPPTVFHNPLFVKPFEELTKLYGLPHYDELDPTPIIAVSFPLVFGFMFGDLGHGLILLAGGLMLAMLIKGQNGLKNLCWILAACGAGAIFAGLLFGEFFGVQIFASVLPNPFDNVLEILLFSLAVGMVQIMIGLVLEFINFAIKRNFLDAILTSLPKMAFYTGSIYLISICQLDFAAWFRGPILLSIVPFVFFIFGKPLLLRNSSLSGEHEPFGIRFFESGDLVIRLLSNTMSYTRILALLMAHYALILVTYDVAGLVSSSGVGGTVLAGVILVVGNLFVIGFEGLIVFIHSLRLHFYEWFSKFYQGTGTKFVPFRQSRLYTELVFTMK